MVGHGKSVDWDLAATICCEVVELLFASWAEDFLLSELLNLA